MTTSPDPTPRERRRIALSAIVRDPGDLLAFGFGAGCAPRAPGTVGSLVAMGGFLLIPTLALPTYLAGCAVAFITGCWLCNRCARRLGVHDHPGIVFDEFVGYWITMAAYATDHGMVLRSGASAVEDALWALAGLSLFRLFDIVKPWPIGWLDRRIQGGFGIMLDDAVAGILALLGLQALQLATVLP